MTHIIKLHYILPAASCETTEAKAPLPHPHRDRNGPPRRSNRRTRDHRRRHRLTSNITVIPHPAFVIVIIRHPASKSRITLIPLPYPPPQEIRHPPPNPFQGSSPAAPFLRQPTFLPEKSQLAALSGPFSAVSHIPAEKRAGSEVDQMRQRAKHPTRCPQDPAHGSGLRCARGSCRTPRPPCRTPSQPGT
ncbi:hypothetical protein GA0061078_1494 [Bifidobacterium bohemicum]|uniref:Uncharacterized protein n=1 Tax=Bifidobacterium bohemicum DSM 22767 TaxID=1437606 RepID=A0A086ZGY3_9BIFI|nr:hypothetical protein BBOH_0585 [Bifidobacterium bohemicum DSM 22767]SCC11161.1 hypothetical protein GA0061078_1494 [Bifidobacterium bohemicum]